MSTINQERAFFNAAKTTDEFVFLTKEPGLIIEPDESRTLPKASLDVLSHLALKGTNKPASSVLENF